jgi:hypothetical protein
MKVFFEMEMDIRSRLMLESRRAAIGTLVVDSGGKPSSN